MLVMTSVNSGAAMKARGPATELNAGFND